MWDTACVLGFFSVFTACQASLRGSFSLQKAIVQLVKLKGKDRMPKNNHIQEAGIEAQEALLSAVAQQRYDVKIPWTSHQSSW